MKWVVIVLLSLMVVTSPIHAQKKQVEVRDAFDLLSNDKKDKLIRMFLEEYPFQNSKEYKNYPETLNEFFTEPIYKKLTGNFMRGYQYNEGFTFRGTEISVGALKSVTEGKPYLKKFIDVLNKVFVGNGIKFVSKDKAPYEIGFCIVSVMPKLTEISFPGVFLEVIFKNKTTGKSLFYRFGQGSRQGIEKAMYDSCSMVLAMLFTHATDRTPPAENQNEKR